MSYTLECKIRNVRVQQHDHNMFKQSKTVKEVIDWAQQRERK